MTSLCLRPPLAPQWSPHHTDTHSLTAGNASGITTASASCCPAYCPVLSCPVLSTLPLPFTTLHQTACAASNVAALLRTVTNCKQMNCSPRYGCTLLQDPFTAPFNSSTALDSSLLLLPSSHATLSWLSDVPVNCASPSTAEDVCIYLFAATVDAVIMTTMRIMWREDRQGQNKRNKAPLVGITRVNITFHLGIVAGRISSDNVGPVN